MTPIQPNEAKFNPRESEHAIALSLNDWLQEAAETRLIEKEAAVQQKSSMDLLDHIVNFIFRNEEPRKHERHYVQKRRR